MTRLAIFDIDGTLTDTNAVDDECFQRAVAEILGLDSVRFNWQDAPHVTDSAITTWICESQYGRAPHGAELDQILARFLKLLAEELANNPGRFIPVCGADDALLALRRAGWDLALATGGWESSARLKLAAGGLQCADLAFASASDALSREEIVQIARKRAEDQSGHSYSRVVSVGDGEWDVRCARALALPFVGIGTGSRAEMLRRAGATIILPDLSDTAVLFDALHSAKPPEPIQPDASESERSAVEQDTAPG
ncbi:MAG: HAD family hydrolase [Anaerolineae bacterium]|nr:HAD family hydrolase [Gemmatimonadaceae bacterium]